MRGWQPDGSGYEREYGPHGYTGWYRCVGGRMSDGTWPRWNCLTGESRP